MSQPLARRSGRTALLPLGFLVVLAAVVAPAEARGQQAAPAGYHLLDGARGGAYLKAGARGAAVLALQRALNRVGYALWEDGVFGGQTHAAVALFQVRSGLFVDGVVGPRTVGALDQALGLAGPPAPPPPPPPPPPATGAGQPTIPARPAGALEGAAFLSATDHLSRAAREAEILREVLRGNIPDRLRSLRAIQVRAPGGDGIWRDVTFHASVDYVAIGSEHDFVRIPVAAPTAQAIADAFGCSPPTRRIVDLIHAHADHKLTPQPLVPGPWMMSNGYFLDHDRKIDAQTAGLAAHALLAGQKKDVVISNRLLARPDRVAIYGWHWPSGAPIQPLSTAHFATYSDYSHGLRLVSRRVEVDGQLWDLADLLRDPVLAPLLSDEGVMPSPRIP